MKLEGIQHEAGQVITNINKVHTSGFTENSKMLSFHSWFISFVFAL